MFVEGSEQKEKQTTKTTVEQYEINSGCHGMENTCIYVTH